LIKNFLIFCYIYYNYRQEVKEMNKTQGKTEDKVGGQIPVGTRDLTPELIREIKIKKYITIGLDVYGASGTVATGIAALLTATGIGVAAAPFFAGYAAFTETADIVTGPLTGLYIHLAYGKTGIGALEALLEAVPIVGDIFPGTTLAHNLYLDGLKEQGYVVPENLYILPKLYHAIKPGVDAFREQPVKTKDAHDGAFQRHYQHQPAFA
jgi:hypothetical protein